MPVVAKRFLLSWLSIGMLVIPALSVAEPMTISLCGIDQSYPPFFIKSHPESNHTLPLTEITDTGIQVEQLKYLQIHAGINIRVQRQPWKRCLLSVEKGLVDGTIGASFTPERKNLFRYP